MKKLFPAILFVITSQVFAAEILINPIELNYPSNKNMLTVSGTNEPAHGVPGSVLCNGVQAVFHSNKSWEAQVPLSGGMNDIVCSFTKNKMSDSKTLKVFRNQLPIASFNSKVSSDNIAPETLKFDSSGSSDPDGKPLKYSWIFGDSSTSLEAMTDHLYQRAGTYTVTLTVTDDFGESKSSTKEIQLADNQTPTAKIVTNKETGKAPLEISFDGSSSTDSDDKIVSYEWDFGQGVVKEGVSQKFTFEAAGQYTVKLKVTDSNEGLNETSIIIQILPPNVKPIAALSAEKLFAHAPASISFDASGSTDSDGVVKKYLVNFGDGSGDQTFSSPLFSHSFQTEGRYTVILKCQDDDGALSSEVSLNLEIAPPDTTPPFIQLGLQDDLLTNEPFLLIPVSIADASGTTTTIWKNGVQVFSTKEQSFDQSVYLSEGINLFLIKSVDTAGNESSTTLSNIILDTVVPTIQSLNIADGDIIRALNFNLQGTASEILKFVTVNDTELPNENIQSFSYVINHQMAGPQDLVIRYEDLAGNVGSITRHYELTLRILDSQLITVVPKDNGNLLVIGQPGAAKPGVQISISSGFFNSADAVASQDGSFQVEMDYFTTAEVEALDPENDTEENFNITFNVDTTFAGIIKDSFDNPIPGVTVSILNSNLSTVTNASGVFSFPNPVLGDQTVVLDGSTVPFEVTQGTKSFSSMTIKVNLGNRQQNVLERPIYMTPKMLDGSETIVEANTAVSVESPHAPGVRLDIPAGSAVFPGGQAEGTINMMEIPAERSSIEMLEQVKPDSIVSLEPSGLSFTERVPVTLPNVNEFPEGMELAILSKNSVTGEWEIDGAATVSESGSIETKPGMGISHFSEIFAAPMGLEVKSLADGDKPSVDTFNGAVGTSITLPSFKVLGQDIAPSLVYNSQWSRPTVVITNIFKLPQKKIDLLNFNQTAGSAFGTGKVKIKAKQYLTPEYIDASFASGSVISDKMRFTGLPEDAVVSYQMDLGDLESGIYPAKSSYEIRYKELTIVTTKVKTRTFYGQTKTKTKSKSTEKLLEAIFPPELLTSLYIQNKSHSEIGQGWRLGFGKKILNPNQDRVIVENENGSISPYVLKNTLETMVFDTNGIDSFSYEDGRILHTTDKKLSLTQNGQTQIISNLPTVSVGLGINLMWFDHVGGSGRRYWNCERMKYQDEVKPKISHILQTSGGTFYLDSFRASIFQSSDSGMVQLNSNFAAAPKIQLQSLNPNNTLQQRPDYQSSCKTNLNSECTNLVSDNLYQVRTNQTSSTDFTRLCGLTGGNTECILGSCSGVDIQSSGQIYVTGYNDNTSIASSVFNNPQALALGSDSSLLVADTGNNIVRKINLVSGTVTPFAGNRSTFDNGDNGPALQASLYHPKGVATDKSGNVYISTEHGYIRKVSQDGTISTFAGKPTSAGGLLTDIADMKEMALSEPSDLAIDSENGYMYVADTGHNRVLRIDLIEEEARVVAGNGTCTVGDTFDGKAALDVALCRPEKLALDKDGNLLILDGTNKRIRRVNFAVPENGQIRYASVNDDNSELVKTAENEFILKYRNGNQSFFNSFGLEIQNSDRVGRNSSFQYDDQKRLTNVTLPTGKSVTITYSGDKLNSITDPAGRSTSFDFDGERLSEVTFPDGTKKEYSYNDDGVLIGETNQRGLLTKYELNEWQRLHQVIRPDGSFITMDDAVSKTIANHNSESDPKEMKSYGADQDSIKDIIADAKGNETAFVKDSNGYVQTIIDTENKITTIERDNKGRPTKITKPDLTYTQLTYNQTTGDLIERFESDSGLSEAYSYNQYGQLLTYKDPLNHIKTNVYDPISGLLLQEIDPNGNFISNSYTGLGLIQISSNKLGHTTSYSYNEDGNVVVVTAPMGEKSIFARDPAGNVISKTNAKSQTTIYSFDFFNRLMSVKTPGNYTTSYSYLPTGELYLITNPAGFKTNFQYDELGRLTKKISPKGQISQLFYDDNDNVIKEITPKGDQKSFIYDAQNRLLTKTLPDDVYQFSYDSKGNLISTSNENSSFGMTYVSILGKDYLKTVTSSVLDLPQDSITYGYNAAGKRNSMSSNYISLTYIMDAAYRMTGVSNNLGQSFSFGYDDANRLTSINRPNSINSTLTFDNNSFLTNFSHKKGSSTLDSFIYTRDQIGNRTSKTTTRGVFNYNYDNENQLISASHPEADALHALETFTYDSLGNRLTDNQGSFSYDDKKFRLEEDYRYLYVYDLNGNLTSKQEKGMSGKVWNFVYNSENQMISAELYLGTSKLKSVSFFYDALGRRVKKSFQDFQNSNSYERRYAYESNEIIAELDEQNDVLAKYTHSGLRTDDVLSVDITVNGVARGLASFEGTYLYLKDGLGSVQAVTTETGIIIQRYIYSSFGELIKTVDATGLEYQNIKTAYTYTNREIDVETGLYYYRARYYDSRSGRFMQEDPHPGSINIPSSLNSAYTYVMNNPTNFQDPQGEIIPIVAAMIIGALIGGTINASFSDGNFLLNFLIGAAAGAAAGGVGYGIGAMIGATSTFGGAIAKGAVIGAASGGIATTTSLLLSGENITSKRNLGRIGLSIVLGGIIGGAFGAFSNISPKQIRPFVERAGEVQGEIYDNGAQEVLDYSFDMINMECSVFAVGSKSYKACMGK